MNNKFNSWLKQNTDWNFKLHLSSFVGAFLGIFLIALFSSYSNNLGSIDNLFIIASFGASAVLIYGFPALPFSQKRNFIFGHLLAGLIGVTLAKISDQNLIMIVAPLSVSLALVIMQITKTVHPPAGGTALLPIIGSAKLQSLGYEFILQPLLIGIIIMLIVAIFINFLRKN